MCANDPRAHPPLYATEEQWEVGRRAFIQALENEASQAGHTLRAVIAASKEVKL